MTTTPSGCCVRKGRSTASRATPASPRRHWPRRAPWRSTRPTRTGEIGGAGLAAGALELGLVDELHIFRNPVLVGGGTPLLPPVTKHVPLDLIETRTFGSRVIYERYGRARDESD